MFLFCMILYFYRMVLLCLWRAFIVFYDTVLSCGDCFGLLPAGHPY